MKAILRTYQSETDYSDRLVDVRDESAFADPYGDAVPFAVGSNQRITSYADDSPPPGTEASLAIQCVCPDTGETGDFLFIGDSHRAEGSRVSRIYPDLSDLIRGEPDWKQVPGDGLTYVRR